MNTNTQDPWTNEDDDANDLPEVAVKPIPVQSVARPNVAADPAIPTLVLPKPEVTATAQGTEAEPEEKPAKDEFPNDYGKCLEILFSMRAAARLGNNATPEQKAAHKKYLRLQLHIHRIQQGSPVVEIDLNKANVDRATHLGTNHSRRSSELARITAALASETLPVVTPTRSPYAGINHFLEIESVRTSVDALRRPLLRHKATALENHLWLAPRQRIAEHKLILNSRPTAEQVDTIVRETATIDGTHFAAIQSIKVGDILDFYTSEIKPRLKSLLIEAQAFIKSEQANARDAEREFFEWFGVRNQQTEVSRQYDETLKQISHYLNLETAPAATAMVAHPANALSRITDADSTVLTTLFGVPLLPNK